MRFSAFITLNAVNTFVALQAEAASLRMASEQQNLAQVKVDAENDFMLGLGVGGGIGSVTGYYSASKDKEHDIMEAKQLQNDKDVWTAKITASQMEIEKLEAQILVKKTKLGITSDELKEKEKKIQEKEE